MQAFTFTNTPPSRTTPDAPIASPPSRGDEEEAWERELAELTGHLDAAVHRQITLIRLLDESGRWARQGATSCAHWLSWRIRLSIGAARERLRVGHALKELPKIDEAFRTAQLGYSQVRAMTRVATSENEERLLELAASSTASQLERICRGARRVMRADGRDTADGIIERWVRLRPMGDGTTRLEAQLTSDEALRVMEAIRSRRAVMSSETASDDPDSPKPTLADALVRLIEDLDSAGETPSPATASATSAETPVAAPPDVPAGMHDPATPSDVPAETRDTNPAADVPAETSDTNADADLPADTLDPATPADVPAETHEPATPADVPAETHDPATPADVPAETHEPATPADVPAESHDPATPAGVPTKLRDTNAAPNVFAEARDTDASSDVPAENRNGTTHSDASPQTRRAAASSDVSPKTRGASESSAKPRNRASTAGDLTTLVVHLSPDILHRGYDVSLHDGTALCTETFRRIACDCGLVPVAVDEAGEPLDVGRKTRSIPPALRTALEIRDGGCCSFPGCTRDRFLHAHHVEHWVDGGETKKDNLVLLCTFHHQLVHEGGWSVRFDGTGPPEFLRPTGQLHPRVVESRPVDSIDEAWAALKAHPDDVQIDENTVLCGWTGERPDMAMCVEAALPRDVADAPATEWLAANGYLDRADAGALPNRRLRGDGAVTARS